MTTFSTSSYHQLTGHLTEIERWLRSMAVPVGRVALYRKTMERLTEVHAAGRIPETFSPDEIQSLILTFLEIEELKFINEHLAQVRDADLPSKLATTVGGPELTRGENPTKSNNHARNVLFELTLAATLASAGFMLEASGICDLRTSFEGRPVFIECKRPQSPGHVDRAIKDGMKQLERRLTGGPLGSLGILAISASKVITQGTQVFRVPTREAIVHQILSEEDSFMRRHGLTWIRKAPPNVIAVIVHIAAVGIANDEGQLYSGKQYVVHPIEGRPDAEIALTRRFYQQFTQRTICA
ncbi:hypothetical protein GALL_13220 [mine drainage metagenome]|uniref:Uncharacterized protein n=1 Tax=mine drainage metagenome TaxID=410659 RepID=A0A1J5TDG0_9ZZZZ